MAAGQAGGGESGDMWRGGSLQAAAVRAEWRTAVGGGRASGGGATVGGGEEGARQAAARRACGGEGGGRAGGGVVGNADVNVRTCWF